MLGNRGLLHAEGFDDLSDRPFRAERQEIENLAPTRLRHRVESIGGSRCSGHACQYIFLYGNMSRATFHFFDPCFSAFRPATNLRLTVSRCLPALGVFTARPSIPGPANAISL